MTVPRGAPRRLPPLAAHPAQWGDSPTVPRQRHVQRVRWASGKTLRVPARAMALSPHVVMASTKARRSPLRPTASAPTTRRAPRGSTSAPSPQSTQTALVRRSALASQGSGSKRTSPRHLTVCARQPQRALMATSLRVRHRQRAATACAQRLLPAPRRNGRSVRSQAPPTAYVAR